MSNNLESQSKFLSLVLRHKPEVIGLELDAEGWASIDQLIFLANAKGKTIDRAAVFEIVSTSDKKRFAVSSDGNHIRANQGHSVSIDLNLAPAIPPEILFHGTATRFASSIQENGLLAGSRQHVHLSATQATAIEVGKRHGSPIVLTIKASTMHDDGLKFYLSDNGVWLTASVPTKYIKF